MQIHSFDAVISEKGAAIQEVIFLDSLILKSLIIWLKSENPILLLSKSVFFPPSFAEEQTDK